MRFREGDRVVVSDPDGKLNGVRGTWYPRGEIGGTILQIIRDCIARVRWDCGVDEAFSARGSWIDLDNLAVERESVIDKINDSLSDFLINA